MYLQKKLNDCMPIFESSTSFKAFMTIFESSTSSQSSEGIDIKSEPNFYTSKTNDSESYKHNTNQYPKDGYRYKKFTSR